MDELARHHLFTETPLAVIGTVRRVRIGDTTYLAKRIRTQVSIIAEIHDSWYMVYSHYGGDVHDSGELRWRSNGTGWLFPTYFPDEYMEWIL